MRRQLILFSTLLFLCLSLRAEMAESEFQAANTAYDSAQYDQAIQLYQSLLEKDYLSADLHFNLANAYFKRNRIPLAILHYEKALKIDPNHQDATYNLELANAKTIDQIESIPELFLYRWWQTIFNLFSAEQWAVGTALLMLSSLLLSCLYFFLSEIRLRKMGFYGSLSAIGLALFSWFMAQQQESYLNRLSYAIIVEPTININSSPSEGSSKLFVLHEGSKVKVEDNKGEWLKISIPNGNEGWVERQYLEGI